MAVVEPSGEAVLRLGDRVGPRHTDKVEAERRRAFGEPALQRFAG
jgi:hypothetical protein